MSRNCPQCGRNLSKADTYFCHVCGAVTGAAGLNDNKQYHPALTVAHVKSVPSNFSMLGIFAGVGVFILLVGSALVSSYVTKEAASQGNFILESFIEPEQGATVVENAEKTISPSPKANSVAYSDVESFLPFRTDFVVVFYSGTDFLDALKFFNIESTFDMDFLKNANRPPYVIILNPPSVENGTLKTSLMLFPTKVMQKGEYSKYVPEDFTETILENVVIVTNTEDVSEEISQISQGLQKGMGLNSYYVTIRSKIPAGVRSKIFVFSDIGVGYVNQLEIAEMPESLKALVQNYMKSGSYYGYVEYE